MKFHNEKLESNMLHWGHEELETSKWLKLAESYIETQKRSIQIHPDLNPLAFSHHHHKGNDRKEEEKKKQNQPSNEGRKEGRKDWGRKMQKQYSVIIQDHDLQKIVEESPPITHTKTRHQLWLEIKNCGQLAKQKGKFNQILINESKDGWIQQNQKGR